MAAVRRRPCFVLCALLTASLAIVGCSLIAPAQTPADEQEHAKRLVQEGRHAEAAAAYGQLAADTPANRDYFELQSADQWIAAGNLGEARAALAAVSANARTQLPTLRALVAAELSVAEYDGPRALNELNQIAVPTQPDEAQSYWAIRGKAAFLAGHPVDGVRAYVERERWLGNPAAVHASRQELYAQLRTASERGTSLTAPPNSDAVVAGWLALGPIAVELARDPMRGEAALQAWEKRYPLHPADEIVQKAEHATVAIANAPAGQIALLLPLSGRSEPVGVAVRDGFIAAYLEQDPALRPQLRIYDVAALSIGVAYRQAIQDGASFVVGPLTKEDVAALVPLSGGRTPVLALNFLDDSVATGSNFYQFALLPEDEARMVARRLAADGRLRGVAILPDGEWGARVGAAFADELSHLGGAVLDTQRYESSRADFSDAIRISLQVHGIKGEPSTHRPDAAFVFFAGPAKSARLFMPQLKFHYAGDVPVYSTSESYEPDPHANADIDGLLFTDMPWMVSFDPATSEIRDAVHAAWPERTARRDRLYAFGFDAYRLVPALRSNSLGPSSGEISGMTGRLRLDGHERIRRDLDWAQIKGGAPILLGPTASAGAPGGM